MSFFVLDNVDGSSGPEIWFEWPSCVGFVDVPKLLPDDVDRPAHFVSALKEAADI